MTRTIRSGSGLIGSFVVGFALLAASSPAATAQSDIVGWRKQVLDSRWNALYFRELSVGSFHTVARRTNGTVVAWGDNSSGQCNVPALAGGFAYAELTAGEFTTIARFEACTTCASSFCFGDGGNSLGSVPCPCGNVGASGNGCNNSTSTGGARLSATGIASPDAIVLGTTGELPTALSIFLQGGTLLGAPVTFGDGTRCIGNPLKRIGVKSAVGGAASYPGMGDASITARSAAPGDPISTGEHRFYQVYHRDANAGFCVPQPSTFNISNAVSIGW